MKRTVAAGFLAAVIAMLAGGARSPSVSPSFQYVIAGEGDVRGMSTDTAHPGLASTHTLLRRQFDHRGQHRGRRDSRRGGTGEGEN